MENTPSRAYLGFLWSGYMHHCNDLCNLFSQTNVSLFFKWPYWVETFVRFRKTLQCCASLIGEFQKQNIYADRFHSSPDLTGGFLGSFCIRRYICHPPQKPSEYHQSLFLFSQFLQTLSSFESFLIGGFAKAVATVITYPLQLIQCRLRVSLICNSYTKDR